MRSNQKNNRRSSAHRTSNIAYSGLEDRRLLAVTTTQVGGQLRIVGDFSDNSVVVRQVNPTTLRVIGDGAVADFNIGSVSRVLFFGSDGDDEFNNTTSIDTYAEGDFGNDTLITRNGNDRLVGGFGDDILISSGGANTLIGDDGDDRINGGDGPDRILSGFDQDIVNGGAGDDEIFSGPQDDVVNAGAGNDTVFGQHGDDTISGGAGEDSLFGGDGDDTIIGGNGNDLLRGGRHNDTLRGSAGDDRLLGELGDDELSGFTGVDLLFGGDGNDFLAGGDGSDFLGAGAGNDNLYGNSGNDNLRGGTGNDNLFGGDNNDRIAGDEGDDTLNGGGGFDRVFGDAGRDQIISTSPDFVSGGTGNDQINLSGLASDTVALTGAHANYEITNDGDALVVLDTRTGGTNDGLDLITGADTLSFSDQTRSADSGAIERVYVQPIIARYSNGSVPSIFYGNESTEFEIKRRIDLIYLEANVDIEWLEPRFVNDTFIKQGSTSGRRPVSDIREIANRGDSLGVGSGNSLTMDIYYVSVTPGYTQVSSAVITGESDPDTNVTALDVGATLLNDNNGQDQVALATSFGIALNLGVDSDADDLSLTDIPQLIRSQRNTILNSNVTQPL